MGGPSALGMVSFLNRLHWFGVVGLCTLGVDQLGRACFWGVCLPLV